VVAIRTTVCSVNFLYTLEGHEGTKLNYCF